MGTQVAKKKGGSIWDNLKLNANKNSPRKGTARSPTESPVKEAGNIFEKIVRSKI